MQVEGPGLEDTFLALVAEQARSRMMAAPGSVVWFAHHELRLVAGGALDVMAAGGIASVDRIFGLHCDPRLDAGKVGVRSGPITAACDRITVRVTGPGVIPPASFDCGPGLRPRQDRH